MNCEYIEKKEHLYTDYNGNDKKEIILQYMVDKENIAYSTKIFKNPFFITLNNNGIILIRVPIYNIKLNYYIPNYKDYVYLLSEKMCIPKSLASGVDKSNQIPATKDNCYIELSDEFIPAYENDYFKTYKEKSNAKRKYIRINDLNTKAALNQYGSMLLDKIL